jgi:hypothetical protein
MPHNRFDALTRLFGAASTRRDVLAGPASALLAVLTPAFANEDSEARKRGKQRKRKSKRKPMPPPPPPLLPSSPSATCTPNCLRRTCGPDGCGGSCECGADQTCRNGICCVHQCSATRPCGDNGCGGSCGACSAIETCHNGSCICSNYTVCSGQNLHIVPCGVVGRVYRTSGGSCICGGLAAGLCPNGTNGECMAHPNTVCTPVAVPFGEGCTSVNACVQIIG